MAIARASLAQRELARSELLEDEIEVLAMGDGDALARSSIRVDAAVRRMHTYLAHLSVADMRRMPQAARSPQGVMDVLARFSCDQCDDTAQDPARCLGSFDSGFLEVCRHGRQGTRRCQAICSRIFLI